MKRHIRLTAVLMAAVLALTLLPGCGSEEGYAFSAALVGKPETLDPIYAVSETDGTVLTNLYENLMRRSSGPAGEPVTGNGLAKSVSQKENHDGTVTWTFRLRKAKWSDGKDLVAQDFVFAWRRLADPANHSPHAPLLSMVAGYSDARASGDMSLLAVEAKNDDTLEVVLEGTCAWFLDEVCTAVATVPLRQDLVEKAQPREGEEEPALWWEDLDALITSGPYVIADGSGDDLALEAFEDYFTGEGRPSQLYLRFADSPEDAAAMMKEGRADVIWPVADQEIQHLKAPYQARKLPVYTVLYNSSRDELQDAQIRRAMDLAIDRNQVSKAAGITALPAQGLIPEGVPGLDGQSFRELSGELIDNEPEHYKKRCTEAVELLSQAGYRNGLDLGNFDFFYVDEGPQAQVAQALADSWWSVLRIRVTPVGLTAEEMETALRSGEYTLAGVELRPVGNDAECFLMPWDARQGGNVVGYDNSAYDTLLSIIATATDPAARMSCMRDAEILLMDDCVLSPVYTTGTGWEVRDAFTGVSRDARGWFSFANTVKRSS